MLAFESTNADMPDDEGCWLAVLNRDRSFDGRFVTGVLSTGIYCRPSCPARHPRRDNVRFFASAHAASQAGLRACLRCSPDDLGREEKAVTLALRMIAASDEGLTLEELAAATGYSPSHIQRIFVRAVGISPVAYARALKAERALDALSAGTASVTEAIYEAGYGASSRFYEAGGERMGMAPSAWKNGGKGVSIRWMQVQTSLGRLLVAATGKGICRLSFDEGPQELSVRFPQAEIRQGDAAFEQLCNEVVAAVETPGTVAGIPLDVQGTAFQEAVWAQLRMIPPGETRSYGQLAALLGKPGASRAVGQANGANPVAVLTPCHRVIASDGTLGGYAYGEEIKRELLRRERGA